MKKYKKHSMQQYRKKNRRRRQVLKKIGMLIAVFAVAMMFSPHLQAFAATPTPAPAEMPDFSNFQPVIILKIIYGIFMAYIAVLGGIQIAKSVQELSTALQQNDTTSMSAALKGIFGGALQAFISVLLGFFGITV